MTACPFHSNSKGSSELGEIECIECSDCGSYRISKTALSRLQGTTPPSNWARLMNRHRVISTRDTH